jgi:hypothetical protein
MAARFDTGSGPVTLSPTLSLRYDSGSGATSVTVPIRLMPIVVHPEFVNRRRYAIFGGLDQ